MSKILTKPIDNPDHISILLPTHGRPQMLATMLASLEEKTFNKNLIDVWLYIDHDDYSTINWLETLPSNHFSFKVFPFIGHSPQTIGVMTNTLWQNSTNSGIYLPCADDYVFSTDKWDELLRQTFNSCKDRLLMVCFNDTIHSEDTVTWMALSAEWANTLGRIITEYFPFWFDDTWLDEIAQMVQRKVKLDIKMLSQVGKGKTKRMRNLPFWQHFFYNTIAERIKEADILRKRIYGENSYEYYKSLESAKYLSESFKKEYKKMSIYTMKRDEAIYSDMESLHNPKQILKYSNAEAKALNHLAVMLEDLLENDSYTDALEILNTMTLSIHSYGLINYLKSFCLLKIGRLHNAEIALLDQPSLSYFDINFNHLLKEIKDKKNEAEVLNQQGEGLFYMGKINNAIEKFLLAVKISSDFIAAYNNLGVAYFNKGDYINALENFRNVITIAPNDETANENLKELLTIMRKKGIIDMD